MSSGDGSSSRLASRDPTRDTTVSIKLLQAATSWLRCRSLLVEKRSHEARRELQLLIATLAELDGQPMNEENARELKSLQEEAAKLESKTRHVGGRLPQR